MVLESVATTSDTHPGVPPPARLTAAGNARKTDYAAGSAAWTRLETMQALPSAPQQLARLGSRKRDSGVVCAAVVRYALPEACQTTFHAAAAAALRARWVRKGRRQRTC